MNWRTSIITVFLVFALNGAARAASVTVNAAGGGNYTNIKAAVTDIAAWGNGDNDTVFLTEDQFHLVNETMVLPEVTQGDKTLTIRNVEGQRPLIVAAIDVFRLFAGNFVFDGLTVMGQAGVDGTGTVGRIWEIENSLEGAPPVVTIRNCIVTRNNGQNQPDLNWTPFNPGTFRTPGSTPGSVMRAITIRDLQTLPVPITVTIEDSVFAFSGNDGDAFILSNAQPSEGIKLTVRRTLIAAVIEAAIRFWPGGSNVDTSKTEITIEESAIFTSKGHCLRFGSPSSPVPQYKVTLTDSIFSRVQANVDSGLPEVGAGGSGIESVAGFGGTFTATRCTFAYVPQGINMRQVDIEGGGTGVFSFTDCIFSNVGLAMRFADLEEQATTAQHFSSLTLNNIAVFPPENAYNEDLANQATIQAFAGLYGGTGPLGADPMFAKVLFDSEEAGSLRWLSTENEIVDVSNEEYLGKASDAGALTGGAEFVGAGPTPTPTPPPGEYTEIIITEDFATDPGWIEQNSRTAPSNFGFSNTNNIGTGAGEAGGQIVRRTNFTWYGFELPAVLDSLDYPFSFEFDYIVTVEGPSQNVAVGMFNPDTVTNGSQLDANPNMILANLDDSIKLHVAMQPPPASSTRVYVSGDEDSFGDNQVHHVKIHYVPTGQVPGAALAAGEFGQVAGFVDGTLLREANLTEAQRNADWLATHFGVSATMNQDLTEPTTFYVDNIVITYYGVEGGGPINAAENWTVWQ